MEIATHPAKVIVAIDFGTTFSGFAYALKSERGKIRKHYSWPDLGKAGGNHYCKTRTSLLYQKHEVSGSFSLDSWGYSAVVNYVNEVNVAHDRSSQVADKDSLFFIDKFKLLLADEGHQRTDIKLPSGLALEVVISDYLRELGEFAMKVLREDLGSHITKNTIEWLITVPAIWNERAKQSMKRCAELAGLVRGAGCKAQDASAHPLTVVLEPEAAAIYCQQKGGAQLNHGDRLLIVDVGGGTTDLVLQEKIGSGESPEVKEVSPSSGGVCGGTFVDERFLNLLSQKISCFEVFKLKEPRSVLRLLGDWQNLKYGFDGSADFGYTLELPARLAREWEKVKMADHIPSEIRCCSSDVIELSLNDMLGIFDPVVESILHYIKEKMGEGSTLKLIMVVGGFSGSPYLAKRIYETFSETTEITIPKEAGAAICCGAVAYGIHGADLIKSRIAKMTYGIRCTRPFRRGDPPHLRYMSDAHEMPYCMGTFGIYVRAGDEVPLYHRITESYCSSSREQTESKVQLLSSSDLSEPEYVEDRGVKKLGKFKITHPSADEIGEIPEFEVSIYFGKSMIEVTAEGKNFGKDVTFAMPSVIFCTD